MSIKLEKEQVRRKLKKFNVWSRQYNHTKFFYHQQSLVKTFVGFITAVRISVMIRCVGLYDI